MFLPALWLVGRRLHLKDLDLILRELRKKKKEIKRLNVALTPLSFTLWIAGVSYVHFYLQRQAVRDCTAGIKLYN